MTREYFNNRFANHCKKLEEQASTAKLPDAQRTFGRISELCAIAHEIGVITQQEYNAHIKHAEDCFYNNL